MAGHSPKMDLTNWPTESDPSFKLDHFIRNTITDNLDDIECHADAWVLPTPNSAMFSQSRSLSVDHKSECKIPSPLIHDMCEETDLLTNHCLLPCCFFSKRSCSEETSGGWSPSIQIPERIRKHRRTDSEIMIRLTDSEFELTPDGTVVVKMAPLDEGNALILPAAIDAFGSSPASFCSSSLSSSPSSTGSESYSALIAQEIERRNNAKKLLGEFDNDDAEIAQGKGKESLRRMLWGKEISDLFPEECARDFG